MKVSTVKEIGGPEHRDANKVAQSLSILELAVIDNVKAIVLQNENSSGVTEESMSEIENQ